MKSHAGFRTVVAQNELTRTASERHQEEREREIRVQKKKEASSILFEAGQRFRQNGLATQTANAMHGAAGALICKDLVIGI